LQSQLFESFPQGRLEAVAALRIQTATQGVNGFVKTMRRQTESQPGREAHANFHPERRSDRQMSFYASGP
jgi:hypothetical protein